MLIHPVLEQLRQLRLTGMVNILEAHLQDPQMKQLSFEERLTLMVDYELSIRAQKRLQSRLKKATFHQSAAIEDIDYRCNRGLDRSVIAKLSQCQWVASHCNVIITGATGTGKSYLACALSHKACLEGFSGKYWRISRLLSELSVAKGDGRYTKIMAELAKTDVLILHDWGLAPLTSEHRRDLLELFDDRHNKRSTIITSQLPLKLWHDSINDNTLADAILDRIIHNAHKIELAGESMRKIKAATDTETTK